MKKAKITAVILALVIMVSSFGTVFAADDTALPAYMISDIVADQSVTVISKNFPADSEYVISMANADDPSKSYDLAKFDTKEGGSFIVTVNIPEELKGAKTINMLLTGPDGSTIPSSFVNTAEEKTAATEEPAATEVPEEPAETEATAIDNATAKAQTEQSVSTSESEPAIQETPAAGDATVYEGVPTIGITNVKPDESISLHGENFPRSKTFIISMSAYNSYSGLGYETMSYEMGETDKFDVEVKIPAELKGISPIAVNVYSDDGFYASNWFYNGDAAASTSSAAYGSSAAYPAVVYPVCDFSIIPSFSILGVTKGVDVTISTINFPANSTFKVMMGNYVAVNNGNAPRYPGNRPLGWHDEPAYPPYFANGQGMQPIYQSCDSPWFDGRGGRGYDFQNWKKPEENAPRGATNQVFNGVEVGTYLTGDGSSQTLTFSIPAAQKNNSPIVIWIQDMGPCGFYSYNYFWNVTAGQSSLPEVETAAAPAEETTEATATTAEEGKAETADEVVLANEKSTN